MGNEKESTKLFAEVVQWVEAILFAVVIALLIRGFVFEQVYVDGSSMESTLSNGDRLFLYKLGYYFSPPKRGDIIVLQVNEGAMRIFPFLRNLPFVKKALPGIDETDYIKRVIGLPGDEIDIRDGYVYINGEKLNEPYIKEGITYRGSVELPLVVGKDKIFVMGDNRKNSRDSREIGLIDYEKIRGKAVFRIFPLKSFGSIYK